MDYIKLFQEPDQPLTKQDIQRLSFNNQAAITRLENQYNVDDIEKKRIAEALVKNPTSEIVRYEWVDDDGNKIIKTAPGYSGALEGVSLIKELTPLGDLEQARYAINSASDGDYTTAGVMAGMALLPNWLEKPLKSVGSKVMRWFKPKEIQIPRQSKLTEAERLGIPKGARNNSYHHKQLGIITQNKSRLEIPINVDNPRFGDYIAHGGEQVVFNDATNPNQVLKVIYNNGRLQTVDDIKEFHKTFFKRNQIPNAAKIEYLGYFQGDNRLLPIYSQQKLNIPNNSIADWNDIHLPKINEILHNSGYKGTETYYGKFNIGDVSPYNIGYDKFGNLRFIDVDVYKNGGELYR